MHTEKVFIQIGGVRQGMIIQSTDETNPVLLVLHGGPGMPEFFLTTTHPTGLEQVFTVVWWEQRGAGLSYTPATARYGLSVELLIADTIEVSQYLRRRFHQNRIALLGHSWGSFLGIQVAAAAPELYTAYIGMGQVSYQLRSEEAARLHMIDAYRARGQASMVRRLAAAPASVADGLSSRYLRLRDRAMHGLGIGTTRDMRSVITGVFFAVWRCPIYSVREKLAIGRGLSFSRRLLWDEFIATDLTTRVVALDLPVYLFCGRYDFTANALFAREYFDIITAPVKGFYTFAHSAHSPLFEEPSRALEILTKDVSTRSTALAD